MARIINPQVNLFPEVALDAPDSPLIWVEGLGFRHAGDADVTEIDFDRYGDECIAMLGDVMPGKALNLRMCDQPPAPVGCTTSHWELDETAKPQSRLPYDPVTQMLRTIRGPHAGPVPGDQPSFGSSTATSSFSPQRPSGRGAPPSDSGPPGRNPPPQLPKPPLPPGPGKGEPPSPSPVPLPASGWMLLAAVAMAGRISRRRG